MTWTKQIKQSGSNSHCGSGRSRRLVLLMATVMPILGLLLFSQQITTRAEGADDPNQDASASPSDRPPTAGQPAADVGKTPSRRDSRTCCRRGRGGLRSIVRRCRRPRRCPRQVCAPEKPDPYAWKDLFDGKTLEGWKVPEFGGEGEVHVKDGTIVMEMGSMMTGITWTGDLPRDNYELEYEAARLDGVDFFATATFPVGEDACSFVTGGWGGTVVGLSCIDYYDASDNLTTTFHDFKEKQWYRIRIRVTPAKIEAWIDDEQVVNQERKGHKIGIRDECDLCRPLGLASYVTTGAVRNIRLRKLKPTAIEPKPPPQN